MAVIINRSTFFFFVASLLFASSVFAAVTESPFIVAHKKVTLKRIDATTERLSVSIDIHNRGSVAAYDVTVTDNSWAKDIFVSVSGNSSESWERLDAGALLTHSFELESKVKGMFKGAPAVITYKIPTKAEPQVAYSTPIMPLDILADKTIGGKMELAKRLLATFGPHVSVASLIVLFALIITKPSSSKGNKKRN